MPFPKSSWRIVHEPSLLPPLVSVQPVVVAAVAAVLIAVEVVALVVFAALALAAAALAFLPLASVVVQVVEVVQIVEGEGEDGAEESQFVAAAVAAALVVSEAAVLSEAVDCHIHSLGLCSVSSHGAEERHHLRDCCVDGHAAVEEVEAHQHQGKVQSLRTNRRQMILRHLVVYGPQKTPSRF